MPNDAAIRVVYPADGHQTHEDGTFVIGAVPPGWQLRINADAVDVSPGGFFGWPVSLSDGLNPIQLDAFNPDNIQETAHVLITVERPAPITGENGAIQVLSPLGDVAVQPGDCFEVACVAPRDAAVTLQIGAQPAVTLQAQAGEGFFDNREAIFAQLHQVEPRIPRVNYFSARIRVPPDAPPVERLPMALGISSASHPAQAQHIPLEATLSVWKTPRFARITADSTVTRSAPLHGARLTPLHAGCHVRVDGLTDGWARVRLNGTETMFVAQCDLSFAEPPIGENALHAAQADAMARESHVTLRVNRHTPLSVRASDARTLRVRLHDSLNRCDFIHFNPHDGRIQGIRWESVDATTTDLVIRTAQALSGYDYAFDEAESTWKITLKTLPESILDVHVLIDPGHGGEEHGAACPDGTAEKDLNLAVSRALRDALQAAGFQVVMTREDDRAVSLEARARQAKEADIVLSLHQNALPDGRDPREHQGASCYYYHGFARTLAFALQRALVESGAPDYGVLYDSLHITRIHNALAVLIELGFVTHPHDYERATDPAWQDAAAQAITQALMRYVTINA